MLIMMQNTLFAEVAMLNFTNSEQLSELLQTTVKTDDNDTPKVMLSGMVRPSQYEMVKRLAMASHLSKADVVRLIFDEWIVMKLRGG